MRKIYYFIIFLLAFSSSVIAQDVPRVISYQGVLVDANGKPENGEFDILFELLPLNGSQPFTWSEQRRGVPIRGGLFHVFLGDSSIPKGFPVLLGDYALTIKIGNNAPFPVRLGSVPSALHALVADSLLNVIDSVRASFKSEIAKLADSSRASYIADSTKMKIPTGVPIGTVLPYMGDDSDLSSLEAEGWYLCDGRLIANLSGLTSAQKTDLQQLFFRSGNPNPGYLPDLRGMFLRGADRGIGRDPNFSERIGNGNKIGSYQKDEFLSHNHVGNILPSGLHNHSYPTSMFDEGWGRAAGGSSGSEPGPQYTNESGLHSHTIEIENNGGNETRPKNVYVNYIIKAR